MRIKYTMLLVICLMLISTLGCRSVTVNNDTACYVGFDYSDTGVNTRNATALIRHFCICNPDNKDCKKLIKTFEN